jgi:hypothetical protein
LTSKALSIQEQVLDAGFTGDPEEDRYLRRDKLSVAQSIVNTTLRADKNRLRQRKLDLMPEILARVAEFEAEHGTKAEREARNAKRQAAYEKREQHDECELGLEPVVIVGAKIVETITVEAVVETVRVREPEAPSFTPAPAPARQPFAPPPPYDRRKAMNDAANAKLYNSGWFNGEDANRDERLSAAPAGRFIGRLERALRF